MPKRHATLKDWVEAVWATAEGDFKCTPGYLSNKQLAFIRDPERHNSYDRRWHNNFSL